MTAAFFVDTNIFLYAIGQDSVHRSASRAVLEAVADGSLVAATSTEVVQEILHVLIRKGRRPEAFVAARQIEALFAPFLPVTAAEIRKAVEILQHSPNCGVRDAVHAATMLNAGIAVIISVDADFDRLGAVTRYSPQEIVVRLALG